MIKYDKIEYQTYLLKHSRKQNKGAVGNDTEKTKTYTAEWRFEQQLRNKIKDFGNIVEAQKYATKVVKSKTWRKLLDEKDRSLSTVNVVAKKRSTGRNTAGWARGNTVTLDMMCGLDEYTLLHEMAHCLGNWHHGRSFRRDLLKLVSRFMGSDAAKTLKASFKESKLPCGEPRKPLSFDAWQAARARAQHMLDVSGPPIKKV